MKFPPRVVIFWVLSFVAVFGSLIFSPGGLGSIGTLAGMGAGTLFMLIALVFSVSDTKDDRKTIDELLAAVLAPEQRAPMKLSNATLGLILCACIGGVGMASIAVGFGAGPLYELFLRFRPVPVFCMVLFTVTAWEFGRPGDGPRWARALTGAWKTFFPVGPIVFMDKLDGFIFPAHTWGYFLFAYIVVALFVNFYWLPRQHALIAVRAFREGDYLTAEQYARKVEASMLQHKGQLLRAAALFYSGRTAEARDTVRDAARWQLDKHEAALALESLGRASMETGDNAGAVLALEGAMKAWPERGAAYRHMAELKLRNNDAGAAEALCRKALEADEHSARDRARDLVMMAHVLAERGRPAAEVREMITEASEARIEESKPELAEVHYHAGCAMLSLASLGEAVGHFEKARELDPVGLYGRRAADELARC